MCGRPSSDGTERRSDAQRLLPDYLTIATVLTAWGVRGELKVRIETDFPERFAHLTLVYLGPQNHPFEFEAFRPHGRHGVLKLKGCDSRDAAQQLSGMEVRVPLEQAMPLGADEYYAYQMVGLEVHTEVGEGLGVIEDVLFTGSNAVLVTTGPRGEVLIPALKEVMLTVDLDAGRLTVRLPPGLLD